MTVEQFKAALASLKDWPGLIGIIGGEPLMHPQFKEICEVLIESGNNLRTGLWTSGGKDGILYSRYEALIGKAFRFKAYNQHSEEQRRKCKHQPLTLAVQEMVSDPVVVDKLIDDCWVQRTWCPTINHFGGYFCEVAAAQDVLLNEGANAWPIVDGWWKKVPEEFGAQRELCYNCGMALPIEREVIKHTTEKFTPKLYETFQAANLNKLDDVQIVTEQLTEEQIRANAETWCPGNYRGDRADDANCGEGKGSTIY